MDPRIVDTLERHPGIDDWTARLRRAEGMQVYLVGGTVENVRRVTRDAYEIEVFNDHRANGEPARGSSTVPLSRDDLAALPTVLDRAVGMASLVHNPPWELPGPGTYPEVPLTDPSLLSAEGMERAATEVADRIRDAVEEERGAGVRLSAAELFVSRFDDELRNSRGIEADGAGTHVLMELALLARTDGHEAEYFRQAQARRLDDLAVTETVRRGARMARDKVHAVPTSTRLGPVVIAEDALDQLLGATVVGRTGAYLAQASAESAYARISRFELGAPVYGGKEPTGDPLNIRSNARRPQAVPSYRFDTDGVPAQDLVVIEDGVLRARPASPRYAQYLGLPVTGAPGVTEVGAGSTPAAELLTADGSLYRIVAFSAAAVDSLSGNFGMEIRLGYEIGTGGERPVTGGSVSGNLFEAMAQARMSRETCQQATYAGPAAIRFEALQVSGET